MLYIYGDSHARLSFSNLGVPHQNYSQNSITMFRIGRDNIIINFDDKRHTKDDTICLAYGEVDCRCHIQRQINMGRNEDAVIRELVTNYFRTIKNCVNICKRVIIVGVIPPTKQNDYERLHGPIMHEFPFVGDDSSRVRYTSKVNGLLQEYSKRLGYIYFNPYGYYTREDGTLKYELSDSCGHLGNNSYFLQEFTDILS